MKRVLRFLGLYLLPPVVALGLAFGIEALIILAVYPGVNPLDVYRVMLSGTLLTQRGISEVLYHATPLILSGLAVALAFRGGLFNIGGHGQMLVGGLAATLTGVYLGDLVSTAWILLPACVLAAMAGGAFWGAIPGGLKAWRGAHEVITTIMLNLVAASLTLYLVLRHFLDKPSGVTQTRMLAEGAWLPRIHQTFGLLDPHVPVNMMLPVAVLAALLVWIGLARTRWGYELRAVGHNPAAAAYGGISRGRVTLVVMALSGGLAGLASLSLIHGHHHYFSTHLFSAEYGFWGIAVALLARNHPLGVIPSALLFGFLFDGAAEIGYETDLPKDLISILQGLVIICVVVTSELSSRWLK